MCEFCEKGAELEKPKENDSLPTLERMLPCWESGRMEERRRIQEPVEDMESRETSDIGGWAQSALLMTERGSVAVDDGATEDSEGARWGGRVDEVEEAVLLLPLLTLRSLSSKAMAWA